MWRECHWTLCTGFIIDDRACVQIRYHQFDVVIALKDTVHEFHRECVFLDLINRIYTTVSVVFNTIEDIRSQQLHIDTGNLEDEAADVVRQVDFLVVVPRYTLGLVVIMGHRINAINSL